MTAYIGILEKEPTSLWGIWFPDLVGCIAAASSSAEVLEQASAALTQWIELAREDGQAIPQPRPLDDLRQDEEVREALSRGDMAVVVSLGGKGVELEPSLLSAVDAKAAERGVTRLDFVREAILDKIAG